jgi:hypothetical protein
MMMTPKPLEIALRFVKVKNLDFCRKGRHGVLCTLGKTLVASECLPFESRCFKKVRGARDDTVLALVDCLYSNARVFSRPFRGSEIKVKFCHDLLRCLFRPDSGPMISVERFKS